MLDSAVKIFVSAGRGKILQGIQVGGARFTLGPPMSALTSKACYIVSAALVLDSAVKIFVSADRGKILQGSRFGGTRFTLGPPPGQTRPNFGSIDGISLVLQGSGVIFVSAGRGKVPWEFLENRPKCTKIAKKSPQRLK